MQIVKITTSHVIQAHAHVLPHMEHLIVVPPSKLKKSPRSREGASFDEMRYFTIVRFVNSMLHPPHLQIVQRFQRKSTDIHWHPPCLNEWLP